MVKSAYDRQKYLLDLELDKIVRSVYDNLARDLEFRDEGWGLVRPCNPEPALSFNNLENTMSMIFGSFDRPSEVFSAEYNGGGILITHISYNTDRIVRKYSRPSVSSRLLEELASHAARINTGTGNNATYILKTELQVTDIYDNFKSVIEHSDLMMEQSQAACQQAAFHDTFRN